MKIAAILLIVALFTQSISAQRYDLRHAIAPAASAFIAGAAWGAHEGLTHHWPAVHTKFPNLNPAWWNPAESWKRKYFQHDPEQGRRHVPVQFTDAKHLLITAHNVALFGAGVTITINQRRPVLHYLIDAGISLVAYSAGNFVTYNLILR